MTDLRIPTLVRTLTVFAIIAFLCGHLRAADPWVVMDGFRGPGTGKHIVFIAGDDEYHSEEMLPQMAKILAKHHGFKCTVLFAVNPTTGEIAPGRKDNIPGLEVLKHADLVVMFLRFRDLPDESMKHIMDYVESGKPIIGIRTSTHAFDIKKSDKYKKWTWTSNEPKGGFGRVVFGETWVNHHGAHGKESTRGIPVTETKHPILKGIGDGDIWGPTDVYTVNLPLPDDCIPIVMGQVLEGMKPTDRAVDGKKNDPMMPIAWVKTHPLAKDMKPRVFVTTMGSAQDFENAGYRRLMINAAYWCLGMEDKITQESKVDLVGTYKGTSFKEGYKKGVKPSDHELKK